MIAESLPSSSAATSRAPGGWWLPLRVLLFALRVPILVRRGPERMARRLEPVPALPQRTTDPRVAVVLARRIDRWLRAGWPLVRRGCLTRGLTRYRFLREAGFDVSLRFGVGEVNGRFEGHCWLVHDERPFLETQDPRPIYTEMWRISPHPWPKLVRR